MLNPTQIHLVSLRRSLVSLSQRFDAMCSQTGRPSIAPEQLLRAQRLQRLYSVRSERLLREEID
jgi:transposase